MLGPTSHRAMDPLRLHLQMRRKTTAPAGTEFRMRGKQHITRIECFSDCVFAFALTLLVVSLQVPKSYAELAVAMRGLLAFGFCFFILFGLWSRHNTFFRRYALDDGVTKALTACLLFVVLAYVYPLKFLFLLVVDTALKFNPAEAQRMLTPGHEVPEVRGLFLLYGGGPFTMSILFYLFYRNAYARRKELELTEIEAYDTRWFALENLFDAAVPVVATVLALVLPSPMVGLAGFAYCLFGLAAFIHGSIYGKGRRMKLAELGAPPG